MRLRFWGTRGSVPTPDASHAKYGGDTSCIEVRTDDPRSVVVLDAGTGIRRLGQALGDDVERVDVLLTHLHLDHIIGLGFFAPLFRPDLEVHLWGPASPLLGLKARLTRYLSPPLFPVRIRDLPCRLSLHDVPNGTFAVPGIEVTSALVCHPGPTVGFRLDDGTSTVAYLPDHEPALGVPRFPEAPEWTSGSALAWEVDTLVHDAQYETHEYPAHIGWGHSTLDHAVAFAQLVRARRLVAFHFDPAHDDRRLDQIYGAGALYDGVDVVAAREGVELDAAAPAMPHGT